MVEWERGEKEAGKAGSIERRCRTEGRKREREKNFLGKREVPQQDKI